MNIWDSLKVIGRLLPVDLLVEEMSRNNIEEVRVRDLLGLLAICDVETGIITLNPNVDREKVARKFARAWCTLVDSADVYVCIWFHEVGHFLERDRLRKNPDHFEVRREAEESADDYARKRFEKWKLERRP